MSWPTKIQLGNSEYSHSYDGSEIRETWYIEPYDAVTAFCAAMLGRVDFNLDGNGQPTPARTLPAQHFLYPYCLATRCDTVPLNAESFSYTGSSNLGVPPDDPGDGKFGDPNLARIKQAAQSYTGPRGFLGARTGITQQIMSQANDTYSAGAFVAVTYQPMICAYPADSFAVNMDAINWTFAAGKRQNVINSGLRMVTPGAFLWYPSLGIAPVRDEAYVQFFATRMMLLPEFNLGTLSQYMYAVNKNQESLSGAVPGTTLPNVFPPETLRFSDWDPEYVQVPAVNGGGEPNGYNRWLNLRLRWDWRTTYSQCVHDPNTGQALGNVQQGFSNPVTWNHVLAYPGTLNWLQNMLFGGAPDNSPGLAWWYSKFSANAAGTDTPAYDYPPNVVLFNPSAKILDPLTLMFN